MGKPLFMLSHWLVDATRLSGFFSWNFSLTIMTEVLTLSRLEEMVPSLVAAHIFHCS